VGGGGSIPHRLLFEPLPGRGIAAAMRNEAQSGAVHRIEGRMEDEVARAARAKKGSPFLSTEQAAFYLGLSPRKMQAMRAAATGPRFRRHSRYVRYHIADLDAWSEGSGARGA
jgi:hypothetical protein